MTVEPQMLTYERVRQRTGKKWSTYGPDVLPAFVADMDFDPPPAVLETITSYLDRGDLGYNFDLIPQMLQAFADWQTRHHGWTPHVSKCRTFNSVLHGIELALWAKADPGDGVILFTPSYHPFFDSIRGCGLRCIDVPLDPDGWRIDPERLEAAVDETTRIILFCNPHNPTGRIFDAAELAAVADVAQRHDLMVLSDEIWGDLTHGDAGVGPHTPLATADERFAGRLVTLGSASKSFNLAGLHLCAAHIDDADVAAAFSALPPRALGMSSTLSFAASIAAWTDCEPWLRGVVAELTDRRNHLARRLAAELPAIGFDLPEATYLAWLDFSNTPIADDPARHLLERTKLALEPGRVFGADFGSFARLNLATTEEFLDDAIDRILSLPA